MMQIENPEQMPKTCLDKEDGEITSSLPLHLTAKEGGYKTTTFYRESQDSHSHFRKLTPKISPAICPIPPSLSVSKLKRSLGTKPRVVHGDA